MTNLNFEILTFSHSAIFFKNFLTNVYRGVNTLAWCNFLEIAIAAPYDDDGKGAVYIYTGEGIMQGKVAQKIQPEELTNFGQSLTVVEDFDNNGVNGGYIKRST